MNRTQKIDESRSGSESGEDMLAPFLTMQRQMRRLMEQSWENIWNMPYEMMYWSQQELRENMPGEKVLPKIHVEEDEDEFSIRTAIPGYSSEDIDISVSDNFLTIHCEKSGEESNEEEGEGWQFSRNIERTVMIPPNAVAGEVTAEMEGDILTLTVPKRREEGGGKTVKIRRV